MKVKIDLEDEKLRERIVKIVQEVGFLINESSDVIITDNLKEQDRWMILVSENVPENIPEGVLDVIDPRLPDFLLRKKFEMVKVYLKFPSGILSYLEDEFEKSKRYGFPLSVIYLFFEDDGTARRVYEILRELLRSSDRFDFLKRNEIMIVLPGTSKEGAERLLKRLKRKFLRLDWTKQPMLEYGVAQVEDWMETVEDLLASLESSLRRL
ncbi:putative diguanylate cyclase [Thermotoga petrophila RKU-1]|uniref:Putative diguanylate cyclase n=1 Tax=Thermotoga petrophila (strain ATCC BAA-488 / DSM 13995 / JCM 10881 / RKU-1) TaxID=390874 RepID=A5IJV0_THEP1|nr:diguanylate cyclase [Thermotoga petrophila]ABQ46473.1 putative diguanylate cyclase [Thermotoga petrophila RKU-1]